MITEIEVVCPSCSPKTPVMHEVLKSGQNPVVKCNECEHVHPTKIENKKPINIRVVVSKADESFKRSIQLDPDQVVSEEDELIVDDESDDNVYPLIVTSIESDGKRVASAKAGVINTIWGRSIDEVIVKVAIKNGSKTESFNKRVPGGYDFVVGEEDEVQGQKFIITHIKIRDGEFSSSKGETVEAKYIKRVYASPIRVRAWGEGKSAWSLGRKARNS
ncbi:MAG: HVO_0476 family zinc finger protein [Methanosarcinaceae archaeon]|nr:HVO_0476 family zinc finger protein [Methanosarcinaceae archaeon]